MIRVIFVLCLFVIAGVNCSVAEEITIAAASDLSFAFREIVAEYEKTTANHVRLTLGSSGNFYAQIQNGAPFDLYFSADIAYPRKLEEAGLTVPGSLYQYAVGRIVMWTGNESHIDMTQGFEALRGPTVKKIAIANPKHAPYGRAAVAAMEHFKVYEQIKDKLVLGENISQAAQFVESGACEVGIIALSLATSPAMKERGTYWEVPAEAHPSLDQGTVILRSSKQLESAKQFLGFIKGAQGQEIMKHYGFAVPSAR
jgi:molybdate transport system substrate-binding protein